MDLFFDFILKRAHRICDPRTIWKPFGTKLMIHLKKDSISSWFPHFWGDPVPNLEWIDTFLSMVLIQRDLSGSSECRRLVDNLIGRILDWNQRGWKGNVLNFFVRLSDWQNFEFCNHFWGKIDNGDNFLPILGLRAGLVSVTASRALNRTLCFSNMAINELKNIQWRLCLKLHHTTHC